MNEQLYFRLAKEDDAEKLVEIYAPYVKNTNITFEYEVPTANEFKQRITKTMSKFPYIVACIDDNIIGYTYASTFRERVAYNWCVETSIYINEKYQGRKIGKLLYTKLEQILALQNITNLVASITYPNPQSIAFHERLGYKKIAHFTKCGYKQEQWYDMIFMEKMINEHTIPVKDVIYLSDLDREIVKNFLSTF